MRELCVSVYRMKHPFLNCSTTKTGKSELDRVLYQSVISAKSNTHYFSEQRHCYWMTFDLYTDGFSGLSDQMLYCSSDLLFSSISTFDTVCLMFGFLLHLHSAFFSPTLCQF